MQSTKERKTSEKVRRKRLLQIGAKHKVLGKGLLKKLRNRIIKQRHQDIHKSEKT